MKNKMTLLGIVVGSTIFLVIYNVFFSANKHIGTVKNNKELHHRNDSLCSQNQELKSENSKLKAENEKLSLLNDSLNSEIGNVLPKAIASIKSEVNETYNWTTPELAHELLKDKLNRNPTKSEFKEALEELQQASLLYFSGYPDPSSKGKKVESKELDKIIANK